MQPEHAPILAAFTVAGFLWGYATHAIAIRARTNQLRRDREQQLQRERMREAAYRAGVRQQLEGRDA
jgi:hypothetical protein